MSDAGAPAQPAGSVPDIAATDASGNPQLVAIDQGQYFPFVLDLEKKTVAAQGHDTYVLNMLARWTSMLPPQAPYPPPPNIVQTKLTENIMQAKEMGNGRFRQQDWQGAIKHYTMAVAMASSRPMWEASELVCDELSMLLANRSAAYASAGAYIEALCDADAVIKIKRAWGKGHFRKGKALAGLQRNEEARAAFLLGQQFEPDNEVRWRPHRAPLTPTGIRQGDHCAAQPIDTHTRARQPLVVQRRMPTKRLLRLGRLVVLVVHKVEPRQDRCV